MPQIILNLDAAHATRLVDALCGLYGYQATITDAEGNDVPNPETRVQFARRMHVAVLKERVRSWERQDAERVAREGQTEIEVS